MRHRLLGVPEKPLHLSLLPICRLGVHGRGFGKARSKFESGSLARVEAVPSYRIRTSDSHFGTYRVSQMNRPTFCVAAQVVPIPQLHVAFLRRRFGEVVR